MTVVDTHNIIRTSGRASVSPLRPAANNGTTDDVRMRRGKKKRSEKLKLIHRNFYARTHTHTHAYIYICMITNYSRARLPYE